MATFFMKIPNNFLLVYWIFIVLQKYMLYMSFVPKTSSWVLSLLHIVHKSLMSFVISNRHLFTTNLDRVCNIT